MLPNSKSDHTSLDCDIQINTIDNVEAKIQDKVKIQDKAKIQVHYQRNMNMMWCNYADQQRCVLSMNWAETEIQWGL